MSENKTRQTEASVETFLNQVEDERKREDSYRILQMMQDVTGEEPKMWGPSMVGFGNVHYKYASGREGDWFLTGFSPRKQNLSLYIMPGFKRYKNLMSKLGKYKTGKSCLYIKRLSDVDENVLRKLIAESVEAHKKMYQ